jgi:ribonuclease P protein component
VSRKVGGAAVRNRLKRRIREVVRRQPIRAAWRSDLVVIAKEGVGAVSADVVRQELTGVLAGRRASGTSVT